MKKYIYPIVCCLSLYACTKESGPVATCSGSFSFSADVQPIINSNCATSSSCHAAGSTNSGGPLIDHNTISSHKLEIKFQVESGLMPKTGSLTADQKNKIICWISKGALNN